MRALSDSESEREKEAEMYVVPPPKHPDPVSGSSSGSGDLLIYQAWKGSNVSFLGFLFHSLSV